MGRVYVVELEGRTYKCKFCKTNLALAENVVSRGFHCRRGKAYLFSNVSMSIASKDSITVVKGESITTQAPVHLVGEERRKRVNFTAGPVEERMMLSGLHTVTDIYCVCCGQIVGWKYETAHEQSQKYKEGKFVLERGRIIDGLDSEFYIDTRPSSSDAEEA